MNLFILTNSDGSPISDKTAAAVTSVTDSTVLNDIGNLVLGDSEPLTIKFTTGSAAAAFAGDATYSISVAVGCVTHDATQNLANGSDFAITSGGWTGRLDLSGVTVRNAANVLGGGWLAQQFAAGPRGGWMTLQVRITNPTAYTYTYATLPVYVQWRVV